MRSKDSRHDRLERQLHAVLHRDCPSPMQLGEYQMGLLAPGEAEAVRTHLRTCLHCQVELRDLVAFLDEPETPSLLTELKEIVVNWRRNPAPRPGLALAGIRGSAARAQTFAAGHLWLAVTIQPDDDERRKLLALITREDGSPLETGAGWLTREGRSVAGGQVDGDGNLVIARVPPGEYDLAIQSDGTRVWVRGVSV